MKYEAMVVAREGCHAVIMERGIYRGGLCSLQYLTVRLDETDDSRPGDSVSAYNAPYVYQGTTDGLYRALCKMTELERQLRAKSS